MKRLVLVLPVMAVGVIATGLFLSMNLSHAQNTNTTMSLDMVPGDNTYDETTNTMTVVFNPNADFCLASATANPATHIHASHLIMQNIEDLVGWQVRLNYIGDQMRPLNQNVAPFTDNTTAQSVGFTNLPIDQTTFVHRDITAAASIPAGLPGPQTALLGATYNGTQDFAISPDSPAKSTPDDSSYSAPNGGVLSQIALQVVGDQTGNTLTMDLDDDNPNPPGSNVVFFDGTGAQTIALAETALGDGQHVEGGVCAGVTPTPTETPGPTATTAPTATRTPGAVGATATATPGAGGAATRTATPRVSPAALPPTGSADDGGPSAMGYVLLLAAVAVPVTGAYCYTMSNQYNGARRVPVVFARNGNARLVVRRDTWDDLLMRDVD